MCVGLLGAVPAGAATHKPKGTTVPPVPAGFVGVDVDGPALAPDTSVDLSRQVGSMVANGVQSIRVAFNWAAAEPYRNWASVPTADRAQFTNVAGSPVDFQATDAVVGDAARRGVTVLPTVLYAPGWDARANRFGLATPQRTGPYGAYLTALIGRYGPHGSFWRQNPGIRRVPIREWQIWNEPNLRGYWPQPFARGYVALLRTAHAAIRRADPGAKVVLGALTNVAWRSLGQVYRVRGARSLFDVVSVNGFTKQPSAVIEYLHFVRDAMAHFDDGHKLLLATEISWPSARGKTKHGFDFDTTEAGQARNIATLIPLIAANYRTLRLAGFYYYTWMGAESRGAAPFDFAGLLALTHGDVRTKPALAAFRRGALALEGCRRKGALATSCIR